MYSRNNIEILIKLTSVPNVHSVKSYLKHNNINIGIILSARQFVGLPIWNVNSHYWNYRLASFRANTTQILLNDNFNHSPFKNTSH